jgi:F-type H+-transporting ATPase subunit delta
MLSSRVLPTSLNLALLIVQRGLVDFLPNIAQELQYLVYDHKNQASAQITTALPLDEAEKAQVRQALEERTGKTILLETRIDPEILGGVVARVGDQIIDGSVRQRLEVLKRQLLNGIAASNSDVPEDSSQAASSRA